MIVDDYWHRMIRMISFSLLLVYSFNCLYLLYWTKRTIGT